MGLAQPSIFPGYNTVRAEFKKGSQPSGAAGARVRVTLTLNNSPVLVYGVRSRVSYELPNDFFRQNYGFKRQMRFGGVDTDFDLQINLTQQNITQTPTPMDCIQGADGQNYHPFASPYMFQGGNNVTFEAERITSYPSLVWTVGPDEFTAEVLPSVAFSLMLNQFVGGRQPVPVRAAP